MIKIWSELIRVIKLITERFVDRQISLDVEHGCSSHLAFLKNVSTTTIEHTVNATDSILRAL